MFFQVLATLFKMYWDVKNGPIRSACNGACAQTGARVSEVVVPLYNYLGLVLGLTHLRSCLSLCVEDERILSSSS